MTTEPVVIRLSELEAVIERGFQTFVDVGNALLEIRNDRLYRAAFATFEDYCRERWGMERANAYRLIDAAKVSENLSPIGDNMPATESQARPLARLEPEAQRTVWQQAVASAPNGKVTAAHVQRAVDEYKFPAVHPATEWQSPTPYDAPPATRPHVANNSGNNEWYTPPEYIAAARDVLGAVDLDPASSAAANKVVGAARYYSAQDDGLAQSWAGRVWMNPPYAADLIGRFADKLAAEYKSGSVTAAIVLVNNATETAWFSALVGCASAVVFPRSRVRFWQPDGTPGAPLQGQAVIYLGDKPDTFLTRFSVFGWGAMLWR